MSYRDVIRGISRGSAAIGLLGIAYCTVNNYQQIKNHPTPLVEEHEKHESRLRVLVKKQYLEHLTQEQERQEITEQKFAIQELEQNPEYNNQVAARQHQKEDISKNMPLFFASLGLLALADVGYLASRPKKTVYVMPYKIEGPTQGLREKEFRELY